MGSLQRFKGHKGRSVSSNRAEDVAALLRLLTYAKTEAERLDLTEAVELLLDAVAGIARDESSATDFYALE